MAKLSFNQAKEFSSGGDIKYFTLKDDGDTAVARLMYTDKEEVEMFAVHRVKVINSKGDEITRYVSCLNHPDHPQPCPLCNSGNYPTVRMYLHMIVDDKYVIWERGKSMISKIGGLFPRYGRGEHGLWSREFEIQRNGAKGDPETNYEIYPLDADGKTPSDFSDDKFKKIDVEEELILRWDANTMKRHLNGEDVYNKDVSEEDVKPRSSGIEGVEVF